MGQSAHPINYSALSIMLASLALLTRPTERSTGWPFLNRITVGMPWMPYCDAMLPSLSVFTFPTSALSGIVVGDLIDCRTKHLAGAAPRSPEIDQHRLAALQNLRREIGFRELQNISGHDKEPFAKVKRDSPAHTSARPALKSREIIGQLRKRVNVMRGGTS